MNLSSPTTPGQHLPPAPPQGLILLLATACGLIVANLYYGQPLAGPISQSLGLSAGAAGLIVTLIQIGYGIGLLFLVPLGDVLENRRLVCTLLAANALALAAAAGAGQAGTFLLATAGIGLCSAAAQVLIPFAAHLAPEQVRGRVVGTVTSGLLLGIMLARPLSSIVADRWGWHAIFGASSIVMAALALVLWRLLPTRQPAAGVRYGAMLASMWGLLRAEPVLRRRAAYQACMFGAFSLFWTTTPLLLAGPAFHLSQRGIALFALAGVAGAIAAPIAGSMADRGHARAMTAVALLAAGIAFAISRIGADGSALALGALTSAAIVLDFGVSANLVIGQRAIFGLNPAQRGRLNGLYMTLFFCGGALGSALGGWSFARGGWPLASLLGGAMPALAMLVFASELRTCKPAPVCDPA